MTRGNQRELARERNAKKQAQTNKSKSTSEKGTNSMVSTEKRMERDADIMRKKQEKALNEKGTTDKADTSKKVVKVDLLK